MGSVADIMNEKFRKLEKDTPEHRQIEFQNARLSITFHEGKATPDNIRDILLDISISIKQGSYSGSRTLRNYSNEEGETIEYFVCWGLKWDVTSKTICSECGEVGKWTKVSKTESAEGESAYECGGCGKVDVF